MFEMSNISINLKKDIVLIKIDDDGVHKKILSELSKKLKEFYLVFSRRSFKLPDKIELPKRKIEENYSKDLIEQAYKDLLQRNKEKINVNAQNIEKIAITETVTVTSKVKDIDIVIDPKYIEKAINQQSFHRPDVVFSGFDRPILENVTIDFVGAIPGGDIGKHIGFHEFPTFKNTKSNVTYISVYEAMAFDEDDLDNVLGFMIEVAQKNFALNQN